MYTLSLNCPLGAKGYSRYLEAGAALPSHSPGLGRVLPAGRYKKRPALRSSLDSVWQSRAWRRRRAGQPGSSPHPSPGRDSPCSEGRGCREKEQRGGGTQREKDSGQRDTKERVRRTQSSGSEGRRGQKGWGAHREVAERGLVRHTEPTIQLRCVRGIEGPRAGEKNARWKCLGPISLSLTVPKEVREGVCLLHISLSREWADT